MAGGEGGKHRRHFGEAAWRQVLARQAGSGLSVAEFCRREELNTSSFFRWRGLLAEQAGEGPAVRSGFVDLGVLGERQPGQATEKAPGRLELKLDLGGGVVLHLVRG